MIANAKDPSIHDTVTVEVDLFGLPISLTAFITNVLADELWLATRLPDDRISRIQGGQGIHLTFDRDGPVVLDSIFLRRLGDSSRFEMQRSRVFAVQRPAGIDSSQRRAHVRADLDRTVRIRSMGGLGGERMGTGRTVNIGAGGILFSTAMPLLFGEELRLAIALTSRDIVIAGGSVVRIEESDGEPPAGSVAGGGEPRKALSKVAVRFDQISEVDQERITCHILQAHRQRRTSDMAAAKAGAGSERRVAAGTPPAESEESAAGGATNGEVEAQAS